MKRILTGILVALIATVSIIASARNLYIWKRGSYHMDGTAAEGYGGYLNVIKTADIDSLSFNSAAWIFNITTGSVTESTTSTISASGRVDFTEDGVYDLSPSAEVGVCFSPDNKMPTYYDWHIKYGDVLHDLTYNMKDLTPGTTYYYRTYVKILDDIAYGSVENESTLGTAPTIIDGHRFVDLGLTSGTLWADCNVGTSVSYANGGYFAWGETITKDSYKKSNYTYSGGQELSSEYDAATKNWGENCSLPTVAQYNELRDECTWATTVDENGRRYVSVTSKTNGNVIYFPMQGIINDTKKQYAEGDDTRLNGIGYYLIKDSGETDANFTDIFHFGIGASTGSLEFIWLKAHSYYGYAARAVAKK